MTVRRPRPGEAAAHGSGAARDRILIAASKLFARRGAAHTGVDAVIAEAGVAKATFYRHFPSKEALVIAWLRAPGTRWFDELRAAIEPPDGVPAERASRLFEAVAQWLEAGDYTGCPYLTTALEALSPEAETGRAARAYIDEIAVYFETLAAEAGHPEPRKAGRQLQTLLAGAISLGVAQRTSRYAVAASGVASALLAALGA
jgi:AcrR family transcriptional regulator